jgi:hypothetical protein
MRFTKHISKVILLACIVVAVMTPTSRAVPADPNNAALLYYQAFLLMPQNQDRSSLLLQDLPYGAEPNDQIREYLKQCQPVIDLAVAASQIPVCDWGLQFSRGFQMRITHLGEIRRLAFLVRDELKVRVTDGQYREALERCLVLRRMAQQVGDDTLVSWLVGVAIDAQADKAIRSVLAVMPADAPTLTWLKSELAVTPAKPLLIQNALNTEEECLLTSISLGRDRLIEDLKTTEAEVRPGLIERLRNGDEAFLEGSRKHVQNHFRAVLSIIDSPATWVQKLGQLDALSKQPDQDAKTNPNALLAATLLPAISKVTLTDARTLSAQNMLKAAIEVYLVKARTGVLPNQLPISAPKDTFTGENFKYEKTQGGFRLSRWTDDPKTDKTWQFEFNVK